MTFQVGDHVLWWGERFKVREITPNMALLSAPAGWVSWGILASHQRPWRFDRALNGWLPDQAVAS